MKKDRRKACLKNVIVGKGEPDMGIFLNPGNEKFQSVLRSKIYVDKTEMLAYTNSVLDTEQRCICVSRPRRFGKTMTASMMEAYYSKGCDSEKLFESLKIARTECFKRHLNKYNVIQADMNVFLNRRVLSSKEISDGLRAVSLFHEEVIRELKEQYAEFVTDSDTDLPAVLWKIYENTGEMFIIMIDEWDALFREYREDEQAQKAYLKLLRGLFKDEPSKHFLKLGYITGILPIKKYGTQSAMNNFDEFTMINPGALSEYVGFTEEEVRQLCETYKMDFDETKRWYDGYAFRRVSHVYNPSSIVKAMLFQEFDSYWTRTETYETLRDYIILNFDGLKDDVVRMIAGGRCKVNPGKFQNDMVSLKSRDDVLSLLVHLGYLAYDMDRKEVYIPNHEIRDEFGLAVEESGWDDVIQLLRESEQLLQATWRRDAETVAAMIDNVHMQNASIFQYNDENALSCVITLAYYNAVNEYTLIREMPAGKGFADIIFLPKHFSDKPAMVVELKWDKSAEGAIAQIKNKQYTEAFGGYRGEVLLVGINYDKKNKEHQCVIEQMPLFS